MATLTLPIFGMTCNGCVQSVVNAFNELSGIHHIQVSLENNHAIIEYDSNQLNEQSLIEVIDDLGFSTTP